MRYLWALPNTAIGLLLAALALIGKGRAQIIDGVIEVHGGLVCFLLKNCVPLRGGAQAMTLGHVVLGRTEKSLELTRRHERVHVRQCEQWGPAFIPAYIGCSIFEMLKGRDAYQDNYFERQAMKREAF